MADDLGYGDLGCYGQEHILSPHIDQLASEGMRFTQCYSGAAVCAPARSVLMTGQHAGYTLVRGNFGLGEPKTSGEPNAQGFDEFYGFLNQRRAHSYYPDYLWKNREKDARAYAAMITRMDRNVGLIMEAVKEVGIHENTIVFFTSDNGAAENTHQWPFFQSSGKLRGVIRDPYEGGIRVPMIVSYPGKISPGSKSELPWYFADVLPTLGALSGSQIPDSIDGISVLPTLMGAEQNPGPRPLYWEFYEMQGWRAVRFGPWKAIQQNMHHQTPADIELLPPGQ